MEKNKIINVLIGATLFLVILFVLSIFLTEMNWDLFDYIVAWVLVAGSGLLFQFISQFFVSKKSRLWVGIIVFILFLYVWAELAVGIFTNLGS
jgi:hypothetical protein